MKIEIKPVGNGSYNLFVDDKLEVAEEGMQFIDYVIDGLLGRCNNPEYTEADEIADNILKGNRK